MKIDLTKPQCESLIDLIELNLLDIIRKGAGIDSVKQVQNILTANAVFHLAIEESEKTLENPSEAQEGLTKEEMIEAIDSVCKDRACNDCPLDRFKDNCFADKNLDRSYRALKEAGFLTRKQVNEDEKA